MNRLPYLLLMLFLFSGLNLRPAFCQAERTKETAEDLEFLEEAVDSAYRGKYRRAAQDLEEVLMDFPGSARAFQGLAFAERMRGRYEEALQAARSWLEAEPDRIDARIEMAGILALLGRCEQAETRLREAFDAAPSSLKTRAHLALFLFERGRREEARNLAREAIRLHASKDLDGDAFYHLCLLYRLLGDLEKAAAAGVYAEERFNGRIGREYRFDRYEALLALGDIYLETRMGNVGSGQRALKCFEDILGEKFNPNHPDALLGMARTKYYASEYGKVHARLDQALGVNPNHAGALALKAHVLTLFRQYSKALERIDHGLSINPRDKGLLAQKAAVLLLTGDEEGFKEALDASLREDPAFGEVYYKIGELLIYHYRFPEAEAFLQKCMEIDPEYHEAYVLLARTLANLGREDEARAALNESLKRDPYDYPWRNNMLEVLSNLEGFLEVDSDLFKLMLDAKEAPVMRRYLQKLGRESVARLSRKYAFEVKTPILMEMFPDHEDFAVRTIGFTGLGALGACFGEVVTLLSPRAGPFRAQFSWSSTLHHELCHAFTLQMSNYRIPRWLTEGVSVFEEEELNPYWRRNMDMELFNAFHNGHLFTLENFDGGFMSSRVLFAYYQAGLAVKFIVERFGIEGLRTMILAYADDLGTARIVEKVFGIESDAFEKAFQAWLWDGLLSRVKCQPFYDGDKKQELMDEAKRTPDDLDLLHKAAWACLRTGKTVDALYFLNKARNIQPDHGMGFLIQGEIAYRKKDLDRAKRYYLQAVEAGVEDLFAYRNLGLIAREEGDTEKAIEYLNKAKTCFSSFVGPGSPRLMLVEIYGSEKRKEDANREIEGILAQGLQDVNLFIQAGRHHADRNEPEKAAPFLEAAIHMDPFRRELHVYFARELRKLSRYSQALEELDVALDVEVEREPENPFSTQGTQGSEEMDEITEADIHAEKGANLLALRNSNEARGEVEKALNLDSNHALALELKKKLDANLPEEP